MSVADLVQRLQSRPATSPQALPEACGSVRTVAPGANTILQAVRTPEPAPLLAIRPVFAPVALFAPKTVEVWEKCEESAPAGAAAPTAEAAQTPAALFDEGWREAFDERAAIMEFDGGLSRAGAEAAALAVLADGEVLARAAQTCAGCRHFGRRRTCLEPVAAGLLTEAQGFGIVWPPAGHGAECPAFTGKMPTAAAIRPHRLTNDEADRSHAPCWDDAEIAAFTARTDRFALLGRADADYLTERLTLRDRDGDNRRLCLECTSLADNRRCLVAARGRLPGADRRLEPVPTILQRCPGFTLAHGLP